MSTMTRRVRRPVTDADSRRMQELYYDGLTFVEIAAAMDRHPVHVARYLRDAGVHQPVRNRLSVRDRRNIADWYERGVTITNIMARFAVSESAIYNILRQYSVPLRYPAISAAVKGAARRRHDAQQEVTPQ